MKFIPYIVTILLTCASHNVFSQGDPDEVDSTKVWIESLQYSFDTIHQGDSVLATYSIKNIGKKPLVIRQVFPSCGCSVVDYDKEPLKSGQTLILKVLFDSHGKKDKIENTFQMFSNAGYHTFYLTGFVLAEQ